MALISSPPNTSAVNDIDFNARTVVVNRGWGQWFGSVSSLLQALTSSGTTALRPTSFLFSGRTYFDTTLGIPIFYNGTIWINAAGAAV